MFRFDDPPYWAREDQRLDSRAGLDLLQQGGKLICRREGNEVDRSYWHGERLTAYQLLPRAAQDVAYFDLALVARDNVTEICNSDARVWHFNVNLAQRSSSCTLDGHDCLLVWI